MGKNHHDMAIDGRLERNLGRYAIIAQLIAELLPQGIEFVLDGLSLQIEMFLERLLLPLQGLDGLRDLLLFLHSAHLLTHQLLYFPVLGAQRHNFAGDLDNLNLKILNLRRIENTTQVGDDLRRKLEPDEYVAPFHLLPCSHGQVGDNALVGNRDVTRQRSVQLALKNNLFTRS